MAELGKIAHAGRKAFEKDGQVVLKLFSRDVEGRLTHPELMKAYTSAMAAVQRKNVRKCVKLLLSPSPPHLEGITWVRVKGFGKNNVTRKRVTTSYGS